MGAEEIARRRPLVDEGLEDKGPMIGQTISHYKVLERLVMTGRVSSARPPAFETAVDLLMGTELPVSSWNRHWIEFTMNNNAIFHFCGAPATGRDHLPPKTMFDDPKPTNLITVPSCDQHNS